MVLMDLFGFLGNTQMQYTRTYHVAVLPLDIIDELKCIRLYNGSVHTCEVVCEGCLNLLSYQSTGDA